MDIVNGPLPVLDREACAVFAQVLPVFFLALTVEAWSNANRREYRRLLRDRPATRSEAKAREQVFGQYRLSVTVGLPLLGIVGVVLPGFTEALLLLGAAQDQGLPGRAGKFAWLGILTTLVLTAFGLLVRWLDNLAAEREALDGTPDPDE